MLGFYSVGREGSKQMRVTIIYFKEVALADWIEGVRMQIGGLGRDLCSTVGLKNEVIELKRSDRGAGRDGTELNWLGAGMVSTW